MNLDITNAHTNPYNFLKRFRGFLPIVIDIETGGFNPKTDALLEIAAVFLSIDSEGYLRPQKTLSFHVLPFEGAHLDPAALEFTGIDPYHPFRFAISEKEALQEIFTTAEQEIRQHNCHRAVLVGHNPSFDLSFIHAATKRSKIKHNPFHRFTTFDTATLSAFMFGETVLAKAVKAAKLEFDVKEAHSAIYDAERTAELFCLIMNRWQDVKKQQKIL